MAVVHLEVATLRDVHRVAKAMRQADRDEILASDGMRPAPCLRSQLRRSEFVRTAFVGDEPLAMLGVILGDFAAVPWMLTTEAVEKYPYAFWCACKAGLMEMRTIYPVLVQMIDARHARALSWARRLGFEQLPAESFGFAGLPFHPFILRS